MEVDEIKTEKSAVAKAGPDEATPDTVPDVTKTAEEETLADKPTDRQNEPETAEKSVADTSVPGEVPALAEVEKDTVSTRVAEDTSSNDAMEVDASVQQHEAVAKQEDKSTEAAPSDDQIPVMPKEGGNFNLGVPGLCFSSNNVKTSNDGTKMVQIHQSQITPEQLVALQSNPNIKVVFRHIPSGKSFSKPPLHLLPPGYKSPSRKRKARFNDGLTANETGAGDVYSFDEGEDLQEGPIKMQKIGDSRARYTYGGMTKKKGRPRSIPDATSFAASFLKMNKQQSKPAKVILTDLLARINNPKANKEVKLHTSHINAEVLANMDLNPKYRIVLTSKQDLPPLVIEDVTPEVKEESQEEKKEEVKEEEKKEEELKDEEEKVKEDIDEKQEDKEEEPMVDEEEERRLAEERERERREKEAERLKRMREEEEELMKSVLQNKTSRSGRIRKPSRYSLDIARLTKRKGAAASGDSSADESEQETKPRTPAPAKVYTKKVKTSEGEATPPSTTTPKRGRGRPRKIQPVPVTPKELPVVEQEKDDGKVDSKELAQVKGEKEEEKNEDSKVPEKTSEKEEKKEEEDNKSEKEKKKEEEDNESEKEEKKEEEDNKSEKEVKIDDETKKNEQEASESEKEVTSTENEKPDVKKEEDKADGEEKKEAENTEPMDTSEATEKNKSEVVTAEPDTSTDATKGSADVAETATKEDKIQDEEKEEILGLDEPLSLKIAEDDDVKDNRYGLRKLLEQCSADEIKTVFLPEALDAINFGDFLLYKSGQMHNTTGKVNFSKLYEQFETLHNSAAKEAMRYNTLVRRANKVGGDKRMEKIVLMPVYHRSAADSLEISSTSIDAHICGIQRPVTTQMIAANSFFIRAKMDSPTMRLKLPEATAPKHARQKNRRPLYMNHHQQKFLSNQRQPEPDSTTPDQPKTYSRGSYGQRMKYASLLPARQQSDGSYQVRKPTYLEQMRNGAQVSLSGQNHYIAMPSQDSLLQTIPVDTSSNIKSSVQSVQMTTATSALAQLHATLEQNQQSIVSTTNTNMDTSEQLVAQTVSSENTLVTAATTNSDTTVQAEQYFVTDDGIPVSSAGDGEEVRKHLVPIGDGQYVELPEGYSLIQTDEGYIIGQPGSTFTQGEDGNVYVTNSDGTTSEITHQVQDVATEGEGAVNILDPITQS